jgi:hypothetical protein
MHAVCCHESDFKTVVDAIKRCLLEPRAGKVGKGMLTLSTTTDFNPPTHVNYAC